MALPIDGQTNWGDPLNADITALQTQANNTQTSLNSHAANSPSDPHGDRSFAQSLVSPITTGTNGPNGYVKLNSSGTIPSNLITGLSGPGGAYTAIYDAVATYGATTGSSDTSTQIQNALTACSNNGGGIVWIGPGTFSLAKYLVIGNNTTLLMSRGTVLQRIFGSPDPPYIISNTNFTPSNTPSSNFKIAGGMLDAIGTKNVLSNCTPVFAMQARTIEISDLIINIPRNNPAIELNGVTKGYVNSCYMVTIGSNTLSSTVPAIRLNTSSTATTPSGLTAGLYNNQPCVYISLTNNVVALNNTTFPGVGAFAGHDLATTIAQHFGIQIANNVFPMKATNNTPIVNSGNMIATYTSTGNNFADLYSSYQNGTQWFNMTLSNGWSNSGQGPNAQWRYVPNDPFSIEIIGDLTIGTSTNGTVVATMTGLPSTSQPLSPQIIEVNIPGTSSPTQSRLFLANASNQLQAEGFSGTTGRLIFHQIISVTA